ncbi:MAG TPA: hypothetical protein VJ826_13010 [Candidatus Polarisedimenticolaceae bacterium]|nr:hypothetical protein [Candidatus Polarisedimenticolaceae bacterium]
MKLKDGALAALLLYFSIGTFGCAPPAPKDLALVSLEVVDTRTLPGRMQDDVTEYRLNSRPRDVVQVKFSSLGNLWEYRNGWGDTYLWTATCREWADVGKMTDGGPMGFETSSVYWNSADLLHPSNDGGPSEAGPYHFFIDINRTGKNASYDLRDAPEDICFQIVSAEMFRPSAKTNVVTIPKEAISAALEQSRER